MAVQMSVFTVACDLDKIRYKISSYSGKSLVLTRTHMIARTGKGTFASLLNIMQH